MTDTEDSTAKHLILILGVVMEQRAHAEAIAQDGYAKRMVLEEIQYEARVPLNPAQLGTPEWVELSLDGDAIYGETDLPAGSRLSPFLKITDRHLDKTGTVHIKGILQSVTTVPEEAVLFSGTENYPVRKPANA